MGLFDKIFKKNNNEPKEEMSSQQIIDAMIANADICMKNGEFSRAFDTYREIVKLCPNTTAMYNLGNLYAQGKGVEQNYLEGAYWFHQANLAGDEMAGKLCTKCMMDGVHQNFNQKTPRMLYDELVHFAAYVYPDKNSAETAASNIYQLAGHHFNKEEYGAAAKFFRAAAEYGDHGASQNYLAVLYNAGAGVEQDDLAALYWFDRAVDHGIKAAKQDRDGIFNAYKSDSSAEEFYDIMQTLSHRCAVGDEDIPKDVQKAAYWRNI